MSQITRTPDETCWCEQAQILVTTMQQSLAMITQLLSSHEHDIKPGAPEVRWRDLCINTEVNVVKLAGKPVKLTLLEWRVLRYLAINRDRWCSYETIINNVWGFTIDGAGDVALLKTHVCHLRAKLKPLGIVGIIENAAGSGYRCYLPEEEGESR